MERIIILAAFVAVMVLIVFLPQAYASQENSKVIIIGAGMSGLSAAKTLSDSGIKDLVILEATNRIGGRVRRTKFAGLSIELGANWVEGVGGPKTNPILKIAKKLKLKTFYSDYSNISSNIYQQVGGLYKKSEARKAFDIADGVEFFCQNLSKILKGHKKDISILTAQRLANQCCINSTRVAIDYYKYDFVSAEPARVTSLVTTYPSTTQTKFGEETYFVADPRGYESVVHDVGKQFLNSDKDGNISDPRLKLNKVVREIHHSSTGVIIKTGDGSYYKADYILVSVSIGVLQTKLIQFQPDLPEWKVLALYEFDMCLYTKIFLKFPYTFWPTGNHTQFFLYAHEKRGYYTFWQQFENEYPGANVLMVTVTDDEARRIEQQPDSETKEEIMEVLKNMFGENIPQATNILVPKWSSNRFFKASYSNWPVGVTQKEYDQLRAPVGRIYFTGEHSSQLYTGYLHGAYFSGIDSAEMMIACIRKGAC